MDHFENENQPKDQKVVDIKASNWKNIINKEKNKIDEKDDMDNQGAFFLNFDDNE